MRLILDAGVSVRRFSAGAAGAAEREHEVFVKGTFEFER